MCGTLLGTSQEGHLAKSVSRCARTIGALAGLDGPTFIQVSNEKNPGWLSYIGDYTTKFI